MFEWIVFNSNSMSRFDLKFEKVKMCGTLRTDQITKHRKLACIIAYWNVSVVVLLYLKALPISFSCPPPSTLLFIYLLCIEWFDRVKKFICSIYFSSSLLIYFFLFIYRFLSVMCSYYILVEPKMIDLDFAAIGARVYTCNLFSVAIFVSGFVLFFNQQKLVSMADLYFPSTWKLISSVCLSLAIMHIVLVLP